MSQRFVRCAHCGLPHEIGESVCPITGRPIEARRSVRAPAAAQGRAHDPPSRGREQAASSAPPGPFEGLESAPPPPLIGQVLGGKYRAIRVLGEGGMGAVYESEHIALHRKVAVKVLHPAQARKKASVARFQNEAHVAGAIGHPNICEIYDMGELEDGSPFLVMELLTGETLADRIASEGALPFDDIVEIIGQVLSGLVAAHAKGIIHRDIKPENVFLTQRAGLPPMVKLLDFGISKVAGADDLHLTRTGMVMGTPFYMSPEQARGDRNLDHRVDLYATGVMMYECLTGRRPFHASNYNALLMQILSTDPRPAREVRPAVPEAFEAVVMKAMARSREKRFQSAAEMQREVQLLRDPGAMRRIPSVAPEPVPLVTPRRREDVPAKGAPYVRDGLPYGRRADDAPLPPPKPVELPPVSVDIEGRDLLDSAPLDVHSHELETSDSGSIEIPIVAEAPVSAKDVAMVPRRSVPPPSSGSSPQSRPMYRPDPSLMSKSVPPATSPSPPPSSAIVPPAAPPRPVSVAPPRPAASGLKANVAPPPKVPPRGSVQQPPPGRTPSFPEYRAPTPTSLDAHIPDHADWEGDDHDADPTEIGSIFNILPQRHPAPTPTPIDADSTERIPPERLAKLPRIPFAREIQSAPSPADPRAEPSRPEPRDKPASPRVEAPRPQAPRPQARPRIEPPRPKADATERLSTDRFNADRIIDHLIAERVSDDEAPTTLFDRKQLKGKGIGKRGNTGGNPVVRSHTTERAPAPTPSGRTPSAAPAIPPLPRARGPKDT